jgi:hypothetical protein
MDARSETATSPPPGPALSRSSWLPLLQALRIALFTAACMGPLVAQNLAPFYLIERILDNGVLLHFDTLAFKRYQLQSTTNLLGSINGTVPWTTIYTVPPVPFENHYIVLDPITNAPAKCYRIVVSP